MSSDKKDVVDDWVDDEVVDDFVDDPPSDDIDPSIYAQGRVSKEYVDSIHEKERERKEAQRISTEERLARIENQPEIGGGEAATKLLGNLVGFGVPSIAGGNEYKERMQAVRDQFPISSGTERLASLVRDIYLGGMSKAPAAGRFAYNTVAPTLDYASRKDMEKEDAYKDVALMGGLNTVGAGASEFLMAQGNKFIPNKKTASFTGEELLNRQHPGLMHQMPKQDVDFLYANKGRVGQYADDFATDPNYNDILRREGSSGGKIGAIRKELGDETSTMLERGGDDFGYVSDMQDDIMRRSTSSSTGKPIVSGVDKDIRSVADRIGNEINVSSEPKYIGIDQEMIEVLEKRNPEMLEQFLNPNRSDVIPLSELQAHSDSLKAVINKASEVGDSQLMPYAIELKASIDDLILQKTESQTAGGLTNLKKEYTLDKRAKELGESFGAQSKAVKTRGLDVLRSKAEDLPHAQSKINMLINTIKRGPYKYGDDISEKIGEKTLDPLDALRLGRNEVVEQSLNLSTPVKLFKNTVTNAPRIASTTLSKFGADVDPSYVQQLSDYQRTLPRLADEFPDEVNTIMKKIEDGEDASLDVFYYQKTNPLFKQAWDEAYLKPDVR